MQQSSSSPFAAVSRSIRCPHCHGCAHRIPRRPIDRIVSLFAQVRRYWCYECNWQGNLRAANALPFGRRAPSPASASLAAVMEALLARRAAAPAPVASKRRALAVAGRGFGK